jgi:hypothetical protein
MRLAAFSLALLLAATPTVRPPVEPAALGVPFRLAQGQEIAVGGELRVRFDAVTADSRCPKGVRCLWTGNARVVLLLTLPGRPSALVTLNTNVDPRSASALGFTVEMGGLEPAPERGKRLRQKDYVVTLVVKRGEPPPAQRGPAFAEVPHAPVESPDVRPPRR